MSKQGTKADQGKAPMDLLAGQWLIGVAQVLAFGALKYASYNWAKGISYSRLFAAAQRHLWLFWNGEDLDVESKLHHLLHASCCLMFLYMMTLLHPELDDRHPYASPKSRKTGRCVHDAWYEKDGKKTQCARCGEDLRG